MAERLSKTGKHCSRYGRWKRGTEVFIQIYVRTLGRGAIKRGNKEKSEL